jgi:uncharacterized membrane protein
MNLSRAARRNRGDNERGATLILVAICLTVFLAASGMSVDLGREVVLNRTLQAVADVTAYDAARYLPIIDQESPTTAAAYITTQAQNAVSENGSNATVTATGGLWEQVGGVWGFHLPPKACGSSVPAAVTPCDAVDITVSSPLTNLFERGTRTQTRSAVGFANPEAGFSIGTYLATISSAQSSVLNTLLGTLGTSVNLTPAGYDGLSTSYLTIQQLISASGGVLTPTNVLNTSLTSAQWDQFLYNAMQTQAASLSCGSSPTPPACASESALSTLSGSIHGSTSVTLCKLVSINGSTCGSQLAQTALSTNLDVLQTLTTEAELANGTNALNIASALNLGVTSATLTTSLVQIPQVAYGPVGTTASTGQVNAVLSLSIVGLGVVNIQVTAATGTATLYEISCKSPNNFEVNASTSAATLTPSAVGLTFGATTVTGAATTTPSFTAGYVPPSPATIPTASNPTPPFKNPDTIGTDSPTITLGTGSGNPLLSAQLSPVFATLDTVLAPVLNSLGVNLAGAQVAGLSINCGSVSLVQ